MRTLNLGILAHVDAGKTSLIERLLHAAGVIDEVGTVDHGNSQTDSLALEQQRGITVKSAGVSFVVNGTTVNLIDTPGHPDFIDEVERVLSVLAKQSGQALVHPVYFGSAMTEAGVRKSRSTAKSTCCASRGGSVATGGLHEGLQADHEFRRGSRRGVRRYAARRRGGGRRVPGGAGG